MQSRVVEEVLVAGDDGSRACGQCERDEVVVGGVAEERRRVLRISELDARGRNREHHALDLLLGDVVAKVAAREPATDLPEQSRAYDRLEPAFVEGGYQQAGWSLRVARDPRQQGACVEDEARQASRRASCTASTATRIASSSGRLKRCCSRRTVLRPSLRRARSSNSSLSGLPGSSARSSSSRSVSIRTGVGGLLMRRA